MYKSGAFMVFFSFRLSVACHILFPVCVLLVAVYISSHLFFPSTTDRVEPVAYGFLLLMTNNLDWTFFSSLCFHDRLSLRTIIVTFYAFKLQTSIDTHSYSYMHMILHSLIHILFINNILAVLTSASVFLFTFLGLTG